MANVTAAASPLPVGTIAGPPAAGSQSAGTPFAGTPSGGTPTAGAAAIGSITVTALARPASATAATAAAPAADGGPPVGPDQLPPTPLAISFGDVLSALNPLQHVPLLGTVYRAATGDRIPMPLQIAGGAVFGGPIGVIGAALTGFVTELLGMGSGFVGGHAPDEPGGGYDAAPVPTTATTADATVSPATGATTPPAVASLAYRRVCAQSGLPALA